MYGECQNCRESYLDCKCNDPFIIDGNETCKFPDPIGYVTVDSESIFKVPEFTNIYFQLDKYFCQESQQAKFNFLCEGEEPIIILGKDLFKILKKLVKDYGENA